MIGDSLGYNTFFGPRGSSTIDYFIVSEDLFHEFSFINVRPPNELSDHCILWCGLKRDMIYSAIDDEQETTFSTLSGKFVLDETTSRSMSLHSQMTNQLIYYRHF